MEKTVLITGASRGIGRATALLFARRSWQVAVGYHQSAENARTLARLIRDEGGTAELFCADISDSNAVRSMVEAAERSLGPVTCLVNNAGIAQQKLFTDITAADWERMIAVNLTGVFHCCQAVLPGMIRRHQGSIINVSSIWGLTGASCEVHYSAVKAGVIGLTKALAKEVGPSRVRINCVAPGVIDTEMNQALSGEDRDLLANETPLMRLGSPEEVAECIHFLADEKSSFLTGQVLSPNGGLVI